MRITADANSLIRAMTGDDPPQATAVAVPIPALCERVWVLVQGYQVRRNGVAVARPPDDRCCGRDGADFADGVIAYEGRWLGADTFVSFAGGAGACSPRRVMRPA